MPLRKIVANTNPNPNPYPNPNPNQGKGQFSSAAITFFSRPEVFLGKGILKIGSKFTGEYHVNLLHIFRAFFLNYTFERAASDMMKNSQRISFGKYDEARAKLNTVYGFIVGNSIFCSNKPAAENFVTQQISTVFSEKKKTLVEENLCNRAKLQ